MEQYNARITHSALKSAYLGTFFSESKLQVLQTSPPSIINQASLQAIIESTNAASLLAGISTCTSLLNSSAYIARRASVLLRKVEASL